MGTVPKSLLTAMVHLRLLTGFALALAIPTLIKAAPTQQAVTDFIASEVEYIQDFFDSISSFFLGDSAQQAEREDDEDGEEYDYGGDDDYSEEEAESRSEAGFAPSLQIGAKLNPSSSS